MGVPGLTRLGKNLGLIGPGGLFGRGRGFFDGAPPIKKPGELPNHDPTEADGPATVPFGLHEFGHAVGKLNAARSIADGDYSQIPMLAADRPQPFGLKSPFLKGAPLLPQFKKGKF